MFTLAGFLVFFLWQRGGSYDYYTNTAGVHPGKIRRSVPERLQEQTRYTCIQVNFGTPGGSVSWRNTDTSMPPSLCSAQSGQTVSEYTRLGLERQLDAFSFYSNDQELK